MQCFLQSLPTTVDAVDVSRCPFMLTEPWTYSSKVRRLHHKYWAFSGFLLARALRCGNCSICTFQLWFSHKLITRDLKDAWCFIDFDVQCLFLIDDFKNHMKLGNIMDVDSAKLNCIEKHSPWNSQWTIGDVCAYTFSIKLVSNSKGDSIFMLLLLIYIADFRRSKFCNLDVKTGSFSTSAYLFNANFAFSKVLKWNLRYKPNRRCRDWMKSTVFNGADGD